MKIHITNSGKVKMVHSDDVDTSLFAGQRVIRRVSQVEPTVDGRWTADMSLLGANHNGVILGPFQLRREALQTEIAYVIASTFGTS